jgi:hypothetical protein
MIFIPIALLLIFIPVVYALGCSIKKTVRIERVVPASVERLHKLMKKREKLLEFNKYMYVPTAGQAEVLELLRPRCPSAKAANQL